MLDKCNDKQRDALARVALPGENFEFKVFHMEGRGCSRLSRRLDARRSETRCNALVLLRLATLAQKAKKLVVYCHRVVSSNPAPTQSVVARHFTLKRVSAPCRRQPPLLYEYI